MENLPWLVMLTLEDVQLHSRSYLLLKLKFSIVCFQINHNNTNVRYLSPVCNAK